LRLRMGFWDEIDNFIDDAMGRKLGGGSTFYGERKSNFNGPSKKNYEEIAREAAQEREAMRPLPKADGGGGGGGGGFGETLSGEELRDLIYMKWGERYPVLIKRKRNALTKQRLYLVVSWKRLGKVNLKLSEEEFVAESDAVAELVSDWGCADLVRNEILGSNAVPKTMTQQFPGLFIPLDVDSEIVETW